MSNGQELRARNIKNVMNAMRFVLRVSTGQLQEHNTEDANDKINMKEASRLKCLALCCIRRLAALIVAFLLGYFDCSIAWLLLITVIIVVLKDHTVQKKFRKLSVRRKETKENLEDRADWLNQAMIQMWPHVLNHMRTKMREEVETNIRATLDKYKLGGNFQFKRVDIGPSPLHLSFIEVLPESPPGEMVICADITYESNCDVTFVWRGIKGGMKDFQMHGRAHLVLRPLINTIPFISGYHIIFPEKPDVQYKLSGVGLFLDIPGLREIVNHIITKRVSTLISESSSSDLDSSTDYQKLIETLEKQDVIFDPEKCEDKSSINEHSVSKQREDSVEKTHELSMYNNAEHIDIINEESTQYDLPKVELQTTKIPSTPTNVDVIVRRGPESVSSITTSDRSSIRSDYNPIPKPSRRLPSKS